MDISGSWKVHQKWNGTPAYTFQMDISADGTISVAGGYVGIATKFPNSYLSLAIGNHDQQTITSYLGNIVGSAMGGEMTGIGSSGPPIAGIWTAIRLDTLAVPEQAYSVG